MLCANWNNEPICYLGRKWKLLGQTGCFKEELMTEVGILLGMVAHACISSTCDVEAEGLPLLNYVEGPCVQKKGGWGVAQSGRVPA
jgi:hypothetical protein